MSRTARQLLGFAVALALFVAVWSLPSPAGLSPLGQGVLAILVAAIVLWIGPVYNLFRRFWVNHSPFFGHFRAAARQVMVKWATGRARSA